jgi:SHS2 domain-containing protein
MANARVHGILLRMHRFVEHTGEVELELEARTEEGVFVEAAAAFRELLHADEGEGEQREIELSAADRALLLVEWVNELVFLAEVEGFVPVRVSSFELAPGRLRATVEGHLSRVPHLVKAVTLNNLSLRRTDDRWHGRLVLDV